MRAFLALILLGSVVCTPAQAADPADLAWEAIFGPTDGLDADAARQTFKMQSPQWWEWQARWRRQVTLRGMAFWDEYPQDPRRWEWLNKALFTHRLDMWRGPYRSAAVLEANAAWEQRGMELRAAAMARAIGPNATWKSRRMSREDSELRAHIDAGGGPGLVNRIIDYCLEVSAAGMDGSIDLNHLVRQAQEVLFADDPAGQDRFLAALSTGLEHLPPPDKPRPWPGLKDFIISTLQPLQAIRRQPYEFSVRDLDGNRIDLARMRGKVVLVYFWSTRCSGCVEAMPHVREVYDRYRERGFEVVGIVFNTEGERREVERLIEKGTANWPQSLQGPLKGPDRSALAARFNFTGVPWKFLLDRQGRLVTTLLDDERLEPQVLRVLDARDE